MGAICEEYPEYNTVETGPKHEVRIKDCYNLGNIEGSDYAGGIVGSNSVYELDLTNCYNVGTIFAVNDSNHYQRW